MILLQGFGVTFLALQAAYIRVTNAVRDPFLILFVLNVPLLQGFVVTLLMAVSCCALQMDSHV